MNSSHPAAANSKNPALFRNHESTPLVTNSDWNHLKNRGIPPFFSSQAGIFSDSAVAKAGIIGFNPDPSTA